MIYSILVKGALSPQGSERFAGFTMYTDEKGNTLLTGHVADQAALHGLFKKIRDSGIHIISVTPVSNRDSRV